MVTLQSTFGVRQGLLSRHISKATDSVGRLSSGNRIQNAKDDVSGLSVATKLNSQVLTLRKQLESGVQLSSMLQVADDGFSNIQDILQRQAALATQSASGHLTDIERGFLAQEFDALGEEIDRLVLTTRFNGISVLNSGKNVDVTSEIADKAQAVLNWSGNPDDGRILRIQDLSFRFRNTPDPLDPLDVQRGDTLTESLNNLAAAINAYDVDGRYEGYTYGANGDQFYITSRSAGLDARNFTIDDEASSARDFFTVTGQLININDQGYYALESEQDNRLLGANDTTVEGVSHSSITTPQQQVAAETILSVTGPISDGNIIRIDNGFGDYINFNFRNIADPTNPLEIQIGATIEESLSNAVQIMTDFQFNTPTIDPHYREYVIQQLEFERNNTDLIIRQKGTGSVIDFRFNDAVILEGMPNASLSTTVLNNGIDSGVNINNVINPDFIGTDIGGFEAKYVKDDYVTLSLTVGQATYTASVSDTLSTGADQLVYFKSKDHGFFTMELAADQGFTVTNQQRADAFAHELDAAFSGLTFKQERGVLNFNGYEAFAGAELYYENDDFSDDLNIINVEVLSAETTGGDARVIIDAGDKKFQYIERDFDGDGQVVGNNELVFRSLSGGGTLTLKNMNQKYDLNTDVGAAEFAQNFLKSLEGFAGSGIDISMNDTNGRVDLGYTGFEVTDLFRINDISIATLEDAIISRDKVAELIHKVTVQQAEVGSAQSRLDYLMGEKQSAIASVDAARGVIADTDIAEESTKFALNQVQQNATVSMIAQSNILKTQVLALLADENS